MGMRYLFGSLALATTMLAAGCGGASTQPPTAEQGAASAGAIRFCQENGMSVVHGECVLMYPKPATAWIHGAHRWVWDHLGRTPK